MNDLLIRDFTHPLFRAAFKNYFSELDVRISNWDRLFEELNDEQRNLAWLRLAPDGAVVGFVLFAPLEMTSCFFSLRAGFLREFWVAPAFRRLGHGSDLLRLAEAYLAEQGASHMLLTTDSAESFYLRRGYVREPALSARNGDNVFVRRLG